jgi:hypothetical protein
MGNNPERSAIAWEQTPVRSTGLDYSSQALEAPERAMFVDNWIRLGLVSLDYTATLTVKKRYSWVESTPLLVRARKHYDTAELKRVLYQLGVLRITDFGKAFGRVVIRSPLGAA